MLPVINPHSNQSRISDFHFVIRRELKERCSLSEQSEWEILLCCMMFPNVVTVVPPILNLMGFFSDLFESFQSIQFSYHGDYNTFFSFLSVYWLFLKNWHKRKYEDNWLTASKQVSKGVHQRAILSQPPSACSGHGRFTEEMKSSNLTDKLDKLR